VIRVLLADDQPLVRVGLAAILRAQPDVDVIGQTADGREALDLVRRLRPDVALIDIRMPHLDGLQTTRLIVADHDLVQVKVIILTTFGLDEYVVEALRIGASGFLVKHCEPVDLTRAVRATAAGDPGIEPNWSGSPTKADRYRPTG
jgi:DNA-binding NarL/FixJ family response regulator